MSVVFEFLIDVHPALGMIDMRFVPEFLTPVCGVLVDTKSRSCGEIEAFEAGSFTRDGARETHGDGRVPGEDVSGQQMCLLTSLLTYILIDSLMIALKSLSAWSSAMDRLSTSVNLERRCSVSFESHSGLRRR